MSDGTSIGPDHEGLRARLSRALAVVVTATVLALGVVSVWAFETAVAPELANRTRLIGLILRDEVQRALDLGIPFDALVGVEVYLADTIEKFDEVERIAIASQTGRVIAEYRRPESGGFLAESALWDAVAMRAATFSLPILDGNRLVGEIAIDVSPGFVRTRMRDVFLDIVVIALVAVLIALELALAIVTQSVSKPLARVMRLLDEQRAGVFLHRIRPGGLGGLGRTAARLNDHAADLAQRFAALPSAARARLEAAAGTRFAAGLPAQLRLTDLADIRLSLFLLSVGSEIAAAFLPVYSRAAARPDWLPPELAAAAPLLAYLAAIACLTPFGSRLVRHVGARALFLGSLPVIVVALAAMGFAQSVAGIALWRGVIGLAYAAATIACQDYAIRAGGTAGAARAVGGFMAVIYAGVFCGASIGGVVADRFGTEAAFMLAAGLVALAGALALGTMVGDPRGAARTQPPPRAAPARRPLDLRHLALVLGIAMPLNAATAIVVWYLTPLMLTEAGAGPAETGRVVMLYYLAAVLFGARTTRFAEGRSGPTGPVLAGALIAGCALMSLALWSGFWAIAAMIAVLGLGHTLIRAPQYAIAVAIEARGGPGLGTLRLFERIGAIAGLLMAALLIGPQGAGAGIALLGLAVLAGAGLYAVVLILDRDGQGRGRTP